MKSVRVLWLPLIHRGWGWARFLPSAMHVSHLLPGPPTIYSVTQFPRICTKLSLFEEKNSSVWGRMGTLPVGALLVRCPPPPCCSCLDRAREHPSPASQLPLCSSFLRRSSSLPKFSSFASHLQPFILCIILKIVPGEITKDPFTWYLIEGDFFDWGRFF